MMDCPDFLTEEDVLEFQKITLKTKRIKLTFAEALDQGSRLIRLIELMGEALNPNNKNCTESVITYGETPNDNE